MSTTGVDYSLRKSAVRHSDVETAQFNPLILPIAGEKVRQYTCCSALSTSEDGCTRGPHVFYESDPVDLHKRHAFTHTRPPDTSQPGKTLDVAALDCEMIYTTGGMRVARVSVVDGDGKEVFDKCVKMDEGVHVVLVPFLHLCQPLFSPCYGLTETLTLDSRASHKRCTPHPLSSLWQTSGAHWTRLSAPKPS